MEIGSIYEINPKDIHVGGKEGLGGISLREVEKYGKRNVAFTMSGRSAIALGLRSLAQNRAGIKKSCLLPAYMCDTVFFPFEQEGWEIHFYHINRNLEAEEEELRRLIERIRPSLFFVHAYYGVDTWKQMRSLLKEWKEQGICIMEDVTQSYYLENVGEEADYVVGSLRKWYPLPDGGFVASKEPLAEGEAFLGEEFTKKRIDILTEKWEYLYGKKSEEKKKAMKEDFLKRNREMEEWLDEYREIGAMSEESAGILAEVDEEECRNRRNRNYCYLCEKLEGKKQFWPILPAAGQEERRGAAPLYFAVYAKEREDLQRFLREHDVYAPVLWPVGKENEGFLTEEERYIYSHMLALPMDQRYGGKEMERMAEVLEEYERLKTA